MSELKGACIIGQSGGPTSVINSSCLLACVWRRRWTTRPSPAYSVWHTASRVVLNDDLL